jgi:hypothetical protein
MINIEEKVLETLIKIEECRYLLKDGKHVLAHEKLLGVQQRLTSIYGQLSGQIKSEDNKDSKV